MPTLPKSLTVRPVVLQGRLEEQRYKKSDDGLRYSHETDSDLWLVELRDGRRATMAVPRRGNGWISERGTTWLTNGPEGSMPKRKSRFKKGSAAAKAYMASIRPGGKRKAAKRRTTKAVARRAKSPGRSVIVVNSPRRGGKRRKGVARRNPPPLSIAGALSRAWQGVIGGFVINATEVGTKLVRGKVFKMPAGETLSTLTEVGLAAGAGIAAELAIGGPMGARVGQLVIDAGFASAGRTMLKQLKSPPKWLADSLGDDGPRRNFRVENGRVVAMDGVYVGGSDALAGQVRGRRSLGGYVRGPLDVSAANMANGVR
jgi:hypothetical protein